MGEVNYTTPMRTWRKKVSTVLVTTHERRKSVKKHRFLSEEGLVQQK